MLLARDPDAALELKSELASYSLERGGVVSYRIAEEGLRIRAGIKTSDEKIPTRVLRV